MYRGRKWRVRSLEAWADRYGLGYAPCYYCKRRIRLAKSGCTTHTDDEATIDHIVPLSRGGKNTRENIVWSCYPCNYEKGDIRLF
jgi:5-methylcytosine-specific restriction protein A